jgi:hypothetical protein
MTFVQLTIPRSLKMSFINNICNLLHRMFKINIFSIYRKTIFFVNYKTLMFHFEQFWFSRIINFNTFLCWWLYTAKKSAKGEREMKCYTFHYLSWKELLWLLQSVLNLLFIYWKWCHWPLNEYNKLRMNNKFYYGFRTMSKNL